MSDEVGQPVASGSAQGSAAGAHSAAYGRLHHWLLAARSYINECVRVLRVTKKPTMFEFKTVVKVSALGLLIIGFIGFVIFVFGKVIV